MNVHKERLHSEMRVAKNIILKNKSDRDINVENITQVLMKNKTTFPNLYKIIYFSTKYTNQLSNL